VVVDNGDERKEPKQFLRKGARVLREWFYQNQDYPYPFSEKLFGFFSFITIVHSGSGQRISIFWHTVEMNPLPATTVDNGDERKEPKQFLRKGARVLREWFYHLLAHRGDDPTPERKFQSPTGGVSLPLLSCIPGKGQGRETPPVGL
jgi:preprotein translocase subunit Sss1